ncbi:MAG: hypothetical protein AAF702_37615 [Chloroflexota bacterium]
MPQSEPDIPALSSTEQPIPQEDDITSPTAPLLPLSPTRYVELQMNGLYGISPERRYIRPDLPYDLYDGLAAVTDDLMEVEEPER